MPSDPHQVSSMCLDMQHILIWWSENQRYSVSGNDFDSVVFHAEEDCLRAESPAVETAKAIIFFRLRYRGINAMPQGAR